MKNRKIVFEQTVQTGCRKEKVEERVIYEINLVDMGSRPWRGNSETFFNFVSLLKACCHFSGSQDNNNKLHDI